MTTRASATRSRSPARRSVTKRIASAAESAVSGILDLFYPPSCISCGEVLRAEAPFCDECELSLEPLPPGCRVCAEPGDFDRCPRCTRRAPPFERAWAPYVHGGPIAHAIHLFKYEDRPELARELGRLLAVQSLPFLHGAPDHIVAIPLHQGRYLSRRYDQAELLAGELGKCLRLPRLGDALVRAKPTARQVGQSELEREANVRDAFAATNAVRGKRVLLVDDVFTTGATARAASAALRVRGATEVWVLTLARAWTG